MQRKAQSTAEEKLAEATHKATQAAHTFSERATGQWGKLEGIFEERVAKALHGLGVPSAAELKALHARVAALEAQLSAKPKATTKTSAKPVAKAATKKTPVKKVARK